MIIMNPVDFLFQCVVPAAAPISFESQLKFLKSVHNTFAAFHLLSAIQSNLQLENVLFEN